MNDNDIQLITALVDGELPAAEQEAVMARMESDAELRAAYDEQLAVASTLRSLPEVSMTAAEQTALRTTLRTQLNLDGAVVAAAAAPWWSRWWAPVTGLATAAVIVFAFVIVPNLGEDDAEGVSAPAEATTVAPNRLAEAPAAEQGSDPDSFAAAPGAEDGTTTETTAAAEAADYSVTAAGEGAELELPLLEEEALEDTGVESARSQATTFTQVDLDAISACFTTALDSWPPLSTSLIGVTQDGESIIGSSADPDTGAETLFYINRTTCAVTAAE